MGIYLMRLLSNVCYLEIMFWLFLYCFGKILGFMKIIEGCIYLMFIGYRGLDFMRVE